MQDTPKQTKLLGATVRGLGVIVAVSSTFTFCYAIVEGEGRVNRRVALRELKRDDAMSRLSEVYSLVPGVVGLAVAA
jgi:hypothetical protein